MTPDALAAFHAAANEYLTADSDGHAAAVARIMPILRQLMQSENASAFIYGGWYFVPYPVDNDKWRLYVFPESQVIGFKRID